MPSLSLQQNLALQQNLSPQMRQSLHLLQTPLMELRALVEQEIQANPVLEEENSTLADSKEIENAAPENLNLTEIQEWSHSSWKNPSLTSVEELERRRQYFFDSLVKQESLADHLLNQLMLAEASQLQKRAAETIVGSLNQDGFLQISLEEIAVIAQTTLTVAEQALRLVQSFHPPGVAARDLKETLLIQLYQRGRENTLETKIIKDGFDLLARKRYSELAHLLNVSEEGVREAARYISRLQPRPGSAFASDQPREIILPEASILKVHHQWAVQMNRDPLPQIKISDTYKDLLADGTQQAQVRSYLKEKIRAGRFFIQSIHHRQQTLEEILKQVVIYQHDFLEQGVNFLRPLTMRQVADKMQVHETTVSRGIANKYVQTPWGIFPIKFFFNQGYTTKQGDLLANASVKETVASLISKEDRHKPLADATIVKILAQRGIKLARRTVAKYRDELKILPSHLRRA